MHVEWVAGRAYADRETIAAIYKVSPRTVRRHCTATGHRPRTGVGPGGGAALYDILAAGDQLEPVAARPAREAATRLYRLPPGLPDPP
jgi:hypothetical protein